MQIGHKFPWHIEFEKVSEPAVRALKSPSEKAIKKWANFKNFWIFCCSRKPQIGFSCQECWRCLDYPSELYCFSTINLWVAHAFVVDVATFVHMISCQVKRAFNDHWQVSLIIFPEFISLQTFVSFWRIILGEFGQFWQRFDWFRFTWDVLIFDHFIGHFWFKLVNFLLIFVRFLSIFEILFIFLSYCTL